MEAFRGTSSQVIAEVPEEIGGTTPTVVSLRQTPSGQTSREDPPLNVQSTSSTRGYVNNPAGLSTSQCLSELVGQPREEPITSTPAALRLGPNIARQVPWPFQHEPTMQQPIPQYPRNPILSEETVATHVSSVLPSIT